MSGGSEDQLAEAAAHEAGHTIAGYTAGLRLERVSLIWVRDHWEGGTRFNDNYNPPWRTDLVQIARVDMAVALSGPTAERLLTGAEHDQHCAEDYEKAHEIEAAISAYAGDPLAGPQARLDVTLAVEQTLTTEPYASALNLVAELLRSEPHPMMGEVMARLQHALGAADPGWSIP